MATIGYARVSTNGQDLALQHEVLKAAGCEKVFAEKISGARSDRPQLARMLKALGVGDTVVVTRLDRLARSTLDLLHTVDVITKAGAGLRSLADAWADTTTPHGKLMLTVLGGLAEFERSLIMARTQAGIQRARERGVAFGRPTKLNPKQRRMIAKRYTAGETAAALAREFDVGEATVWRTNQDMQISRIRLSDKTSRLHPRHVVPKPAQAYEPEVPVKVREWIRPALASPDLVLEAQPPAQPHSGVVVERSVRLDDGAYFEVVRPSAQRAVQLLHHLCGLLPSPRSA